MPDKIAEIIITEAKEFFNKILSKRKKMKAGDKFVKYGEMVKVVWLNATCVCEYEKSGNEKMVWFEMLNDTSTHRVRHVLTERDFLEQYKPYEPVYEIVITSSFYCSDEEFLLHNFAKECQPILFTKRERVQ